MLEIDVIEILSSKPVTTKPAYEYGVVEFGSDASFGVGILTGEQNYHYYDDGREGGGLEGNLCCSGCGKCGSSQAKKVLK